MYSTPLELAQWGKSNGIVNAVIASEHLVLPLEIQLIGRRIGGGKGLQYYSHRTMPYLLVVAPYDKYNGIFKLDAVIAWKLMALYPEMEILRERPSFVWVFCLIYSTKSLKVLKISNLQIILGYWTYSRWLNSYILLCWLKMWISRCLNKFVWLPSTGTVGFGQRFAKQRPLTVGRRSTVWPWQTVARRSTVRPSAICPLDRNGRPLEKTSYCRSQVFFMFIGGGREDGFFIMP